MLRCVGGGAALVVLALMFALAPVLMQALCCLCCLLPVPCCVRTKRYAPCPDVDCCTTQRALDNSICFGSLLGGEVALVRLSHPELLVRLAASLLLAEVEPELLLPLGGLRGGSPESKTTMRATSMSEHETSNCKHTDTRVYLLTLLPALLLRACADAAGELPPRRWRGLRDHLQVPTARRVTSLGAAT